MLRDEIHEILHSFASCKNSNQLAGHDVTVICTSSFKVKDLSTSAQVDVLYIVACLPGCLAHSSLYSLNYSLVDMDRYSIVKTEQWDICDTKPIERIDCQEQLGQLSIRNGEKEEWTITFAPQKDDGDLKYGIWYLCYISYMATVRVMHAFFLCNSCTGTGAGFERLYRASKLGFRK